MNAIQRRDPGEALRSIARSYNVNPARFPGSQLNPTAGGACADGQKH
jgi:hypothetical protein